MVMLVPSGVHWTRSGVAHGYCPSNMAVERVVVWRGGEGHGGRGGGRRRRGLQDNPDPHPACTAPCHTNTETIFTPFLNYDIVTTFSPRRIQH